MSSSSSSSSRSFEPRARHSCTAPLLATGKMLYLWGGLTQNFNKTKSELTAAVEMYNPYMERWNSIQTRGVPPPGLYGGASACSSDFIYVYGGLDGRSRYGSLHRLDIQSLRWTELSPEDSYSGPMKKEGCGMVIYKNTVVVFGGYGIPNGIIQGGSEWIRKDQCPNGWSNEIHCFDLDKGVWSSAPVTGSRPPPCTSFTMTMINDHSVILFGGRQSEQRYNHSYILDLEQMHWTKLNHDKRKPCPIGRSSHTAVCLDYGEDCPQLVVAGGVDNALNVRSDIWIMDVRTSTWKEVSSNVLQSRCSHSAASFHLAPGLADIIVFGGCPKWPENPKTNLDFKCLADTTILRFEKQDSLPNGEWLLVDVANKAQRGSCDRLHEKMQKLSFLVHHAQKQHIETEASCAAAIAQCNFEIQNLIRSKGDAERRTVHMETRCQELSRRLENMEIEHEGERRDWAEQAARRAGYEEKGWLVRSREINVLDEVLGGGGWGEVMVAEFRGVRVAAKRLYRELQYPYYHDVFMREMNVAAKLRHPNLVQFIGASMDEEMVILMELMPTSLRQHLTSNAPAIPSAAFRISVSMDVVKALNYLHLMQPHPIIHRDISSANVLLEPLPNQKWRAKVTDYGSVNLQNQLFTKNPGSPAYSAPESNNPSLQSPKMDMFSYGVLLVEMCTARFPDSTARERMIGSIEEEWWVNLIYQCIQQDPQRRPSAALVISIVKTL